MACRESLEEGWCHKPRYPSGSWFFSHGMRVMPNSWRQLTTQLGNAPRFVSGSKLIYKPRMLKLDDRALIHTKFIGGDGNFRLQRHHKGGGELKDPSLFGDEAFYAPQSPYPGFCVVRGGAPDDQAVRTPFYALCPCSCCGG